VDGFDGLGTFEFVNMVMKLEFHVCAVMWSDLKYICCVVNLIYIYIYTYDVLCCAVNLIIVIFIFFFC
jgi:hypothetical protein